MAEPMRWCGSCGAENPGDGHFCRACGRPLARPAAAPPPTEEEATSPTAEPPTSVVAAAPPPAAPRPRPAPAPAEPGDRWPARNLLVGLLVVLVLGGAGGFALLRDGGGDAREAAPSATVAEPEPVEPEPVEPEPSPAGEDEALLEEETDIEAEAEEPTEDVEVEEEPEAVADDSTPTGVVRAHWQAISEGDYEAAFDLMAQAYRDGVSSPEQWVAGQESYAADVRVELVRYERDLGEGGALVFADVLTRDRGPKGDEDTCNRFAGTVRVVREDGAWRYWPNGPRTSWEPKGQPSPDDPRCAPLFE